jgi:tetratricopeptide (TPR) repeat protein
MPRLRTVPALLAFALTAQAADVFVPPVLKGVKGDGKGRTARPVDFPAPDEQWTLVQSRHFSFVSSADEKKTRALAQDLETLAAALAQLNPRFQAEAPSITRVILFSRHREAQPYFNLLLDRDEAHVSGVYVTQKTGGAMILDFGIKSAADRTPFHELVHNLISNTGVKPPLWLEEGIAEYFSNANIRDRVIHAGGPVMPHVQAITRRNLIPLEQLFSVVRESDTYNLPAGQRAFYAESWAIVDWLMRFGGKRQEKFYAFLADVDGGTDVAAALKKNYSKDLIDIQHALEAYSGYGRPTFAIAIPVPDVDTATTSRRLERADILYELGSFIGGIETQSGEAERHFRAALESNPRHAKSIAAIGGLRAADGNYEEAAKYFDQAIVADPADPSLQLAYAEALLRTEIGVLAQANVTQDDDVPRFRKARELARKAMELGTTETGRAWGDLGVSYIVEQNAALGPGIEALEKAHALLPGRLDYTMHLFALYRRTGSRAKADPLFTILDAARNPHVAYAARAVTMRVELARANDLVMQNKLSEAVAVIRDMAKTTPDVDAKADLERQASDIARVQEQNRQIEIYNRAIGQVNSGDYRAALKTINELLTNATDAGVIRDAKKLQKQLQARK